MSDQFHREYLLQLPLPLAQLYSRAYNAKDTRSRHDHAYYVFEASIKLLSCALAASYLEECHHRKGHVPAQAIVPARTEKANAALRQLQVPSLGQWVQLMRTLAVHYEGAMHHPMAGVWRRLSRKLRAKESPALLALYNRIATSPDEPAATHQTCTLLQLFDRMVAYRNTVVGHGGPRLSEFYEEQMGPLVFPAVNELLGSEGAGFGVGLPDARLIYLTELRTLGDGRHEVAWRELTGLQGQRATPFIIDEQQLKQFMPLQGGFIGLGLMLGSNTQILRFGSLMRFRESEVADEVLLFNRLRRERLEFISYTTGRIERDAEGAPYFASQMAPVSPDANKEEAQPQEEINGQQKQQIEGYELLTEIGRGGMGLVHLARQEGLGRLVAIKTLPADLREDSNALARFRREIRVLGSLDHPNVVKLLDVSQTGGSVYYTMEYVPGCDLHELQQALFTLKDKPSSQLLEKDFLDAVGSASAKRFERLGRRYEEQHQQPLPMSTPRQVNTLSAYASTEKGGYVRRVVQLIRHLAWALDSVHQSGMVHRDISPGNVMVTPRASRVVLMDFGLAQWDAGMTASLSHKGGFVGKLRYAAPELFDSDTTLGPEADVRSLGVVLWELLTREQLFADIDNEARMMHSIQGQELPLLRRMDVTLPAELEALVARATALDPSKRIQSAAEFMGYLDMWLNHIPLPIHVPTTVEVMARWASQNKGVVAVASVGMIGLACVTSVFMWRMYLTQNDLRNALDNAQQQAEVAKQAQEQENQAREDAEAHMGLARESFRRVLDIVTESEAFRGVGLYDVQAQNMRDLAEPLRLYLATHPEDESVKVLLGRIQYLSAEAHAGMGAHMLAQQYALEGWDLLASMASTETLELRTGLMVLIGEIDLSLPLALRQQKLQWDDWLQGDAPGIEDGYIGLLAELELQLTELPDQRQAIVLAGRAKGLLARLAHEQGLSQVAQQWHNQALFQMRQARKDRVALASMVQLLLQRVDVAQQQGDISEAIGLAQSAAAEIVPLLARYESTPLLRYLYAEALQAKAELLILQLEDSEEDTPKIVQEATMSLDQAIEMLKLQVIQSDTMYSYRLALARALLTRSRMPYIESPDEKSIRRRYQDIESVRGICNAGYKQELDMSQLQELEQVIADANEQALQLETITYQFLTR